MGRLSTFSDTEVFSAVGRQLSSDGVVTLQTIVKETGVSIGSLYHRYENREGLLAQTWLDAVQTFQVMFLEALEESSLDAGEEAALATPRFCRAEPDKAKILACCRQSEFLSDKTPQPLRDEIAKVNDTSSRAVRSFAQKNDLSVQACTMGMVAFPLGAVRLFLPEFPVPSSIDGHISAAYRAVVVPD